MFALLLLATSVFAGVASLIASIKVSKLLGGGRQAPTPQSQVHAPVTQCKVAA
jgi:hypothetical protein